MDIIDIITASVIFVACFAVTVLILLGLICAANWFIHLEPATQVFYGVIFIIAFVLSAAVTYYIFR